jgi:hypothetical protein
MGGLGTGLDPNNPNIYGHTFYIDAQGNRHFIPGGHEASAIRALGLKPEEVLMVAPGDIGEYGRELGALTSAPPIVEGGPRPFTPRAVPFVTPAEQGNILLPDLSQLAGIWRFLDPQSQSAIASAYGVAGLGGGNAGSPIANALAQIERSVKAFTPGGSATRAAAGVFG